MRSEEPIKRLILSEAQRESLFTRLERRSLEQAALRPPRQNRRAHKRWTYQQLEIAIAVEHPGGGISRMLVCPRNLSAGGLGFIHPGYLHRNSRCKVSLRQLDGQTRHITGQVVSCRHVEGMLHEIGVQFNDRIDPANFISQATATEQSEQGSISLHSITGRVLYIDDSIDDQELVKFVLGSAGAEVTVASTGAEGMEHALQTQFAVVVTELQLPDMPGVEIVRALRQSGFARPIIGVTTDEEPQTEQSAIAAGCAAVLRKPLDFAHLTTLLHEQVNQHADRQDAPPLLSDRWENEAMRPLILRFLDRLPEQLKQLKLHLDASDAASATKICRAVKGAAGGYGYPALAQAADQLRSLVDAETTEIESIRRQFDTLATLCVAARSACLDGEASDHPRDR